MGFQSGEKKWFTSHLVDSQPDQMAIEIKPVRATDGTHLRNGFIKFLNSKLKEANLDKEELKKFSDSMALFRGIIPTINIDANTSIIFVKNSDKLHIYLKGSLLGIVENRDLARWFFQAYLQNNYTSPTFVQDVGKGLSEILN